MDTTVLELSSMTLSGPNSKILRQTAQRVPVITEKASANLLQISLTVSLINLESSIEPHFSRHAEQASNILYIV